MQVDKKANPPAIAIGCFVKGLQLLASPALRSFVIVPILINVVLYSIAFALGYYYIADVINHFIPSWLQWLQWLLWPIFFAICFSILCFTFMILANILAAPFYGRLSAKTLALITGQTTAIVEPSVTKVLWAECKRALYFAINAIPLLIISIIPGLNVIAPVLWMLFGAWSMALEYTAYPMENTGLLFSEQKKLLKKARLGSSSFGGITALALTIPVFNFIVAPAAVVGATVYFNQLLPHRH